MEVSKALEVEKRVAGGEKDGLPDEDGVRVSSALVEGLSEALLAEASWETEATPVVVGEMEGDAVLDGDAVGEGVKEGVGLDTPEGVKDRVGRGLPLGELETEGEAVVEGERLAFSVLKAVGVSGWIRGEKAPLSVAAALVGVAEVEADLEGEEDVEGDRLAEGLGEDTPDLDTEPLLDLSEEMEREEVGEWEMEALEEGLRVTVGFRVVTGEAEGEREPEMEWEGLLVTEGLWEDEGERERVRVAGMDTGPPPPSPLE